MLPQLVIEKDDMLTNCLTNSSTKSWWSCIYKNGGLTLRLVAIIRCSSCSLCEYVLIANFLQTFQRKLHQTPKIFIQLPFQRIQIHFYIVIFLYIYLFVLAAKCLWLMHIANITNFKFITNQMHLNYMTAYSIFLHLSNK